MATINDLKRKSRIEEQLNSQDFVAKQRAGAINALISAGEPEDRAATLVDRALDREELAGYEPGSDERIKRVLATIKTVIALYTSPAPMTIPVSIAQVTVDQSIQIRVDGLDPARVEDYRRAMADGDQFPPIVVYWDAETDTLWLADGFHRMAAAKLISTTVTMPAEIRTGSRQCAEEYAATCNARHGLAMTRADKRAAVERLLKLHADWPDRKISRKVGCSPSTVGTARREFEAHLSGEQAASVQIGQIEERTVTRGDTTYTYTPPKYATLRQIENCILNDLNVRFGFRGRADYDPKPRIDFLQAIKDNYYRVPPGLHLPDKYYKKDLIQVIDDVLEQLRREWRSRLAAEEAHLSSGQAASVQIGQIEERTGRTVTRSPTPQPAEPRSQAVADRIRDFLLSEDVENLRAQLAVSSWQDLHAALRLIYVISAHYECENAAQTLYDAILTPWDGEDDQEPESAPAHVPTAQAVDVDDDHVGCPECGGRVVVIVAGDGESRNVCEDCGATIEPQLIMEV